MNSVHSVEVRTVRCSTRARFYGYEISTNPGCPYCLRNDRDKAWNGQGNLREQVRKLKARLAQRA